MRERGASHGGGEANLGVVLDRAIECEGEVGMKRQRRRDCMACWVRCVWPCSFRRWCMSIV